MIHTQVANPLVDEHWPPFKHGLGVQGSIQHSFTNQTLSKTISLINEHLPVGIISLQMGPV